MLSLPRACIQSLVRELRYCKPLSVAKKNFFLFKNWNKNSVHHSHLIPTHNNLLKGWRRESIGNWVWRASQEGQEIQRPSARFAWSSFLSQWPAFSQALLMLLAPPLPTELSNGLSQDHGLELSYKLIHVQYWLGHLQHPHSLPSSQQTCHGGIIILTFLTRKLRPRQAE